MHSQGILGVNRNLMGAVSLDQCLCTKYFKVLGELEGVFEKHGFGWKFSCDMFFIYMFLLFLLY